MDFDSVQVMRFSPETGRVEEYANYAYATSAFERPFQFCDAPYPETFPQFGSRKPCSKSQLSVSWSD